MTYKKGHRGYWLGKKKPLKQETKDKIRKTLMGHKVSEKVRLAEHSSFKKGHTPWNKGKPWSKAMKKKISLTNKRLGIKPKIRNNFKSGAGHPLWRGGVTPANKKARRSIQFRLWREAVFARDGWTCQKYGFKSGKLHPHHILNFAEYPELRFAIDNGITLSEKAHKEFHRKYGRTNNTREQINEFLNL